MSKHQKNLIEIRATCPQSMRQNHPTIFLWEINVARQFIGVFHYRGTIRKGIKLWAQINNVYHEVDQLCVYGVQYLEF